VPNDAGQQKNGQKLARPKANQSHAACRTTMSSARLQQPIPLASKHADIKLKRQASGMAIACHGLIA